MTPTMLSELFPYYMLHPECGKPAYRMTRKPQLGELIRASDFRTLEGREVRQGEQRMCLSCGSTDVGLLRQNIVKAADYDNQEQVKYG